MIKDRRPIEKKEIIKTMIKKENLLYIILIAIGLVFSLLGPCWYHGELARDIYIVDLLIKGDYSIIFKGITAGGRGFSNTFGGLYYLAMAPVRLITDSIPAFFLYSKLLMFLGIFPLKKIVKLLTNDKISWIAITLFAISSSRIITGYWARHCFIVILPGMYFHLYLLKCIRNFTVKNLILTIVFFVICISFHLAYVPMLAVVPIVILLYNWPIINKNYKQIIILLGLIGIVGVAYWFVKFRFYENLMPFDVLWDRLKSLFLVVLEQIGLCNVKSLNRFITISNPYNYYTIIAGILIFVPVFIYGLYSIFKNLKLKELFFSKKSDSKKRLFISWIIPVLLVQILASFLIIESLVTFWGYRLVTPIVPAVIIILSIGTYEFANYLQLKIKNDYFQNYLILLFFILHIITILPIILSAPLQFGKNVVNPNITVVNDMIKKEWKIPFGFVENRFSTSFDVHEWSQHIDFVRYWDENSDKKDFKNKFISISNFNNNDTSWLSDPSLIDYFVIDDQNGFVWFVDENRAADTVKSKKLIRLMRYSPDNINSFSNHKITWLGDFRNTEIIKNYEESNHKYPLIVLNSKPSEDLKSELVYKVIIELIDSTCVLGCGFEKTRHDDNDSLRGPYIKVIGKNKQEYIRIPYSGNSDALNALNHPEIQQTKCALKGWNVDDIEDVRCGVEFYIDSSYYITPKSAEWSIYN